MFILKLQYSLTFINISLDEFIHFVLSFRIIPTDQLFRVGMLDVPLLFEKVFIFTQKALVEQSISMGYSPCSVKENWTCLFLLVWRDCLWSRSIPFSGWTPQWFSSMSIIPRFIVWDPLDRLAKLIFCELWSSTLVGQSGVRMGPLIPIQARFVWSSNHVFVQNSVWAIVS